MLGGTDSREAEKQCTEQETVVLFYTVITSISDRNFFINKHNYFISLQLGQINLGLNQRTPTKISSITIRT